MHDTVFKQAAALMEGIIRLHPFPDGNKRTALLTAWSFLFISGHYLVTPLDTIRFMVDVAKNGGRTGEEITELVEYMAAWLEERTATTSTSHKALAHKYMIKPARRLLLVSLTIVGMLYAHYKLKYWLASDTHPQYAKDKWRTMTFLFGLTFGVDKWIKRNESTANGEP